jgi:hypothetical protein
MTLLKRLGELVKEDLVLADHLHERMLDLLTGATCAECRATPFLPQLLESFVALLRLVVALFGFIRQI